MPKAPVGDLEGALREVITVEWKDEVISIRSKPAEEPSGFLLERVTVPWKALARRSRISASYTICW